MANQNRTADTFSSSGNIKKAVFSSPRSKWYFVGRKTGLLTQVVTLLGQRFSFSLIALVPIQLQIGGFIKLIESLPLPVFV